MTTADPEDLRDDPDLANQSNFPDIVDDAYPERERVDDPQIAALPGDDYQGVNEFGTTVEEQIQGESLDDRLAREVPEPFVDPLAPQSREETDAQLDRETAFLDDPEGAQVGRLVEPDEGAHTDLEKDVVAREAFGGEYDVSAEESAMHVEREG